MIVAKRKPLEQIEAMLDIERLRDHEHLSWSAIARKLNRAETARRREHFKRTYRDKHGFLGQRMLDGRAVKKWYDALQQIKKLAAEQQAARQGTPPSQP